LLAICVCLGSAAPLQAQAINPEVFKRDFEQARQNGEVVAKVRVLAAVCADTMGQGKAKTVTLNVCLQVLNAEKGTLKKNDIVVVRHNVTLPSGPGPGTYGYMGAVRRFPFTPGVQGDVVLRWDGDQRRYLAVAGWVGEPNGAAIPTEVGQALVAGDTNKGKS
jgi:hypothetical protein